MSSVFLQFVIILLHYLRFWCNINIKGGDKMNYFAKNLKFLREQKRYDQQKVADDLNVPQSTLSCWEKGIRTPKIEQIIDIANYFNVDMDIVSKDYSNNQTTKLFDEVDILFDKHKDKLSKSDKAIIKAIIEERIKATNEELNKD